MIDNCNTCKYWETQEVYSGLSLMTVVNSNKENIGISVSKYNTDDNNGICKNKYSELYENGVCQEGFCEYHMKNKNKIVGSFSVFDDYKCDGQLVFDGQGNIEEENTHKVNRDKLFEILCANNKKLDLETITNLCKLINDNKELYIISDKLYNSITGEKYNANALKHFCENDNTEAVNYVKIHFR